MENKVNLEEKLFGIGLRPTSLHGYEKVQSPVKKERKKNTHLIPKKKKRK